MGQEAERGEFGLEYVQGEGGAGLGEGNFAGEGAFQGGAIADVGGFEGEDFIEDVVELMGAEGVDMGGVNGLGGVAEAAAERHFADEGMESSVAGAEGGAGGVLGDEDFHGARLTGLQGEGAAEVGVEADFGVEGFEEARDGDGGGVDEEEVADFEGMETLEREEERGVGFEAGFLGLLVDDVGDEHADPFGLAGEGFILDAFEARGGLANGGIVAGVGEEDAGEDVIFLEEGVGGDEAEFIERAFGGVGEEWIFGRGRELVGAEGGGGQ